MNQYSPLVALSYQKLTDQKLSLGPKQASLAKYEPLISI
jgi:hypothetical protein